MGEEGVKIMLHSKSGTCMIEKQKPSFWTGVTNNLSDEFKLV